MPHTLPDIIAREIRAELARQRVSAKQIAELLELDQAAISRRLAGTIEFRTSEVEKIARLLGVPVTQFVGADIASAA